MPAGGGIIPDCIGRGTHGCCIPNGGSFIGWLGIDWTSCFEGKLFVVGAPGAGREETGGGCTCTGGCCSPGGGRGSFW